MALTSGAPHLSPQRYASAQPSTCPANAFPMYGPAFEADPLAQYEAARRHGSVVPARFTEDGSFWGWLVLGYNEVLSVLRNRERLFSNDSRYWNTSLWGQAAQHPTVALMRRRDNVLCTDGAAHERLRRPISASLGQLNHRHIKSYIRSICDELIAKFIHTGHADLMGQYASLAPMQIMMGVLGIDEADANEVRRTTSVMLSETDDAHHSIARLDDRIANLVRAKQSNPGADLISWMLSHGRDLSTKEHNDQAWGMLAAGLGGCTSWISQTMLKLLDDPALSHQIRAGSHSVSEAANSALWKHSPIQNVFGRWALRNTVLGNAHMRQGDLVVPSLHGANADPAVQPSESASLENRAHLSWSSGEHACPGRNLATTIVITAVEHLLQRIPHMSLAVPGAELCWEPTLAVRTLRSLPVKFTPTQPPPSPPLPSDHPSHPSHAATEPLPAVTFTVQSHPRPTS